MPSDYHPLLPSPSLSISQLLTIPLQLDTSNNIHKNPLLIPDTATTTVPDSHPNPTKPHINKHTANTPPPPHPRPSCLKKYSSVDNHYLLAPLLSTNPVPDKVYRWLTYLSAVSPNLVSVTTTDYIILRQSILVQDPNTKTALPVAPAGPLNSDDHPLSLSDESQWSKFFAMQETQLIINKDVIRTFPDHDFFVLSHTQTSLKNILTIHSLHHHIPYRQGMHELAAVMLWIVYQERSDSQSLDDRESLAYYLYEALMHLHAPLFEKDNAVNQSNRFMNIYLRAIDAELHTHLTQLEIEPHLYGLRWLRLLFVREFSLSMVTDVWDGLLCLVQSHPTGWMDHICYMATSVLLASRQALMQPDYSQVMSALMRYSSESTGSDVVLNAIQFRYRYAPVIFDLEQRSSRRPSFNVEPRGPSKSATSMPGSPAGSFPVSSLIPAVKVARGALRAISAVLSSNHSVHGDELQHLGPSTTPSSTHDLSPL